MALFNQKVPYSSLITKHLSCLQPPAYQFQQPQLGVMHQLKKQLEERTRILQDDIMTQQQELHDIREQLQLVNSSNIQVSTTGPAHLPLLSAASLPRGPPYQRAFHAAPTLLVLSL